MNKNANLESERSKVKRQPRRGFYDFKTIAGILDAAFTCNIGFVFEDGPVVIPTCFGRKENKLYFHGALNNRMLKRMKEGAEICFTVTIVDGLVLARSAFHHSINYRSVLLFGKAEEITGSDEKTEALKIISDQMLPGRWEDVRPPNEKELNSTSVLCLEINEGSAKIRTGPAVDEEEDLDIPAWAGILPAKLTFGKPEQDELQDKNIPLPEYLEDISRI